MKILSVEEIYEYLEDMDGWIYKEDKIWKEYLFNDFREALVFILRVGFEAEMLGHHPTILNEYNSVSIAIQTQEAGYKVTETDVQLARDIDLLMVK